MADHHWGRVMPKLLTKAEFKKKRPNGNYQNYLNFIIKNGSPAMKKLAKAAKAGGGGGGGGRAGGGAAPSWLSSPAMTYEQMVAQAEAEARGEIDPMRLELQNQIDQTMQQAQQQGQAISGMTTAMMPFLQAVGPAVQDAYQDASGAIAGMGQGFAGLARDMAAANAAQTEGLLQKQGAPTENVQAAVGQASDSGTGDVIYGLGGYIPGSTLEREGAAAAAYGARLPSVASARGQDAVMAVNRQAAETAQSFRKQLADLQTRFPGLKADALRRLMEMDLAKEGVKLDWANYRLGVAASNLDAKRLAQEDAQFQAGLAQEDAQFQAGLAQDEADAAAEAKGARGEKIANRNRAIRRLVDDMAEFALSLKERSAPADSGGLPDVSDIGKKPMNRAEAKRLIKQKFLSELNEAKRRFALKDIRINRMIEAALDKVYGAAPQGSPSMSGFLSGIGINIPPG